MKLDFAAIKLIADHVRAIDPDDELVADMIEGETDALQVADTLIARIATVDSHMAANKAHIDGLKARNDRFKASKDAARGALLKLLEAAGLKKLERPEATFSRTAVRPALIDGPLDTLPAELIRTKIEPDKAAIKEALNAGVHVPGWQLGNGGETVTVRFK